MFKKIITNTVVVLFSIFLLSTLTLAAEEGLVAYWSFDKCDATDSSGNNNNGEKFGDPKCTDGIKGKAFRFKGTPDYFKVPGDQFNFTNELSLSLWVNPENNQVDWAGLIDKSHAENVNNEKPGGWVLQRATKQSSTSFYFDYADGIDYAFRDGRGGGITLKPNEWNHVVVTKKGKTVTYYLNGDQVAKHETKNSQIVTNDLPLFIGNVNGHPRYFKGLLDEIRIYNRALKEKETKELYKVNYHRQRRWLSGRI